MGFLKQLIITVLVVGGTLYAWVTFDPGAGGMLKQAGVPASVLAAILPEGSHGTGPVAKAPAAGANAPGAGQGQRQGPGGGRQAPAVVAQPVKIGRVNDKLAAIGSGEAFQSVTVTPQVAGPLSEIRVASGDHVKKGDILARLSDEEQVIALDQAKVAVKSATEKAELYKNLKSTVSRIDAFNADIAVETARLAVDTATLNLKRRDIVAPIDGIAGIVTVNPGDYVTTTTSIVTLDDRSQILVDFWVPERFAPIIKVGHPVQATSVARPAEIYQGSVEAVDNRIDEASRTLRIRARIANENDTLRAGMAFNVTMVFDGEPFPAVDPLAIQWDSDGAFVWLVDAEKAAKTAVRIIQRNPDLVLVEAGLKEGDLIITEGVQRVRDGGAVRVLGGEDKKVAANQ